MLDVSRNWWGVEANDSIAIKASKERCAKLTYDLSRHQYKDICLLLWLWWVWSDQGSSIHLPYRSGMTKLLIVPDFVGTVSNNSYNFGTRLVLISLLGIVYWVFQSQSFTCEKILIAQLSSSLNRNFSQGNNCVRQRRRCSVVCCGWKQS